MPVYAKWQSSLLIHFIFCCAIKKKKKSARFFLIGCLEKMSMNMVPVMWCYLRALACRSTNHLASSQAVYQKAVDTLGNNRWRKEKRERERKNNVSLGEHHLGHILQFSRVLHIYSTICQMSKGRADSKPGWRCKEFSFSSTAAFRCHAGCQVNKPSSRACTVPWERVKWSWCQQDQQKQPSSSRRYLHFTAVSNAV